VQLGHAFACFGAFWRQQAGEAQFVQPVVGQPFFGICRALLVKLFAVVTRQNPRLAQFSQTLLYINGNSGITVWARGVVHRYGFVLFKLRVFFRAANERRAELDFTHRHADIIL
jgi:hypothetical protein